MTVDKAGAAEPERARPTPPPTPDSSPTRQLCAAVYIDPDICWFVLGVFLAGHRRTWPPNYGLDTSAVVRHAWRARRWRRGRDVLLTLMVLATVVIAVTRWAERGALAPAAATAALIILAVLVRRILRRKGVKVRTIGGWIRKRSRPVRRIVAAASILLVGLAVLTGQAFLRALRPTDGLVVGTVAFAILVIGVIDAFVVVGRARRFWPPDHKGPPRTEARRDPTLRLPNRLERRLSIIEDHPDPEQTSADSLARVLVYDLENRRKSFVNNTFVGSGVSIGPFEINVDVSRGRKGSDGERLKPGQVDLLDLHRSLEQAARAPGVPDLWRGYRMYVDGHKVPDQMLPDASGPPVPLRPLPILLNRLRSPIPGERTYLCVQAPVEHWSHQIIVTLFVRAKLTEDNLILHNDILILPGLRLDGRGWPRIPTDRWTHIATALRLGTTRVWGATIRSPASLLREAGMLARRCWSRVKVWYWIRHGLQLQHGAVYSIREKLALGATIVHPDARQDINGTIAFLLQLLRNGLQQYLESLDIDTAWLDRDIRTVIHNQQTKIERLHAKNVTFGDNSPAGDNGEEPEPDPDEE
jgi:hypothetical protein